MSTNPLGFKDAAGRQLEINDTVMTTFGGHAELFRMKVVGFTKKQIRLESSKTIYATSGRSGAVTKGETVLRYPSTLVILKTADGRPLG